VKQEWVTPVGVPEENSAAEIFYSGAITRILRNILALAAVLVIPLWARFGWRPAAGFALGVAVSYLNFHWLARAVQGLADRILEKQSQERSAGIVGRFLLRYLLIGAAAYVIFVGWSAASRGLLLGLCLPVAAMLGEAAYEMYVALRRGL
jgi:ATP synthase I chain